MTSPKIISSRVVYFWECPNCKHENPVTRASYNAPEDYQVKQWICGICKREFERLYKRAYKQYDGGYPAGFVLVAIKKEKVKKPDTLFL